MLSINCQTSINVGGPANIFHIHSPTGPNFLTTTKTLLNGCLTSWGTSIIKSVPGGFSHIPDTLGQDHHSDIMVT